MILIKARVQRTDVSFAIRHRKSAIADFYSKRAGIYDLVHGRFGELPPRRWPTANPEISRFPYSASPSHT